MARDLMQRRYGTGTNIHAIMLCYNIYKTGDQNTMIKTKKGILFLSISLLLAGSTQLCASEDEHEHHEAHVHGEAQLLIALEGNTLEIEFSSPAMNIVGFEHQPVDEAQLKAVKSAIGTLKQPDLLFSITSAAKCDPMASEVESPLADHSEHDHKEETHSDFTGHYHFQCAEMSRLETIEIELFEQFPGIEVIEAQSISKRGQQKIDLTPGHSTLDL
ncbi:MAG: DUF2796 domain-containing protein [Candidatus Sedimenticola sp. 4PFRAG1]